MPTINTNKEKQLINNINTMPCTNPIIAAIDIGTSKTVAIAGTKDEQGRIKILGIGEAESKGVIRGTVQNIGLASASVREAVEKCQNVSKVLFKNVYVGIGGRNISGLTTSHSKAVENIITDDDIAQLTEELYHMSAGQDENIIHVIPQNYHVDNINMGINPKGCAGRKLEGTFYIVKGKDKAVRNIRQAIEMAGLKIIKLILEPLASAEAVMSKDEKEIGVLIADIGAGTADIAVYKDDILRYTSVVPLGGKAITNDIKKGCAVLERQAEQIKIQYGAALSQKDFAKKAVSIKSTNGKTKDIPFSSIATIINARVEEILGGIAYELDNNLGSMPLPGGIIITGGTAKLKSLLQLAKFRLAMAEARTGTPLNIVSQYSLENYVAATGLIIKGMEYTESIIELRKKAQQAEAQTAKEASPANGNKASKDSKNGKEKKGGFMGFFKSMAGKIFNEPDDSNIK